MKWQNKLAGAVGVAATLCLWPEVLTSAFAQQPALPSNAPANTLDLEDVLPEPTPPSLPDNFPAEAPLLLELPASEEPAPFEPAPAPTEEQLEEQFRIGTIELLGITVDPAELTVMVDGEQVSVSDRISALSSQRIGLDDLLALRSFITQAYVSAGYVTSGAFIPEQDFAEGEAVQIQIVEGGLELVEISGLSRLRESYVRSRIRSQVTRPLRQTAIEAALQRLQLDPLIDRVSAQLLAGSGPGQSILSLTLEESPSLNGAIGVNNYRAVSVGSEQVTPYLSYSNLLGIGDRIDISDSLSQGSNSYSVAYRVPVNARDGSLSFSFTDSASRIVETEFRDLNIRGNSQTASLAFQQPLVRSPTEEFSLGLAFDLRESETFFDNNIPFSESRASVLRFSQDWVKRTPTRVLAARSQFSLGLNAFNATVRDSGPDGEFLSWRGQFQWVEQLPQTRLLITRISSQLTSEALLPLEQFSLGGFGSVRGYSTNRLVTDSGIVVSTEFRLPLSSPPGRLQLTPFLEGGIGWDSNEVNSLEGLASMGVGLLWQTSDSTRIRVDYGYPLINRERGRNTLQENGLTFSLDWAL